MEITQEALMDYLACPVKHRYRHILKTDPLLYKSESGEVEVDERMLEEVFEKQMHQLCYHLFHYVQDEKYPSEYILRQKWGSAWAKGRKVDDLMHRQKRIRKNETNHHKYMEEAGIRAIEGIHKKFKDAHGIPLLIGMRMDVKVGKHKVNAVIDLVRELNGKLELMEFNSGMNTRLRTSLRSRPVNLHIEHDIATTLAALAFEQFSKAALDRIVYYDFISNREFETSRGKQDYQNLEQLLNQVEKAMEAEICYPVLNEQCLSCPFQLECTKGTWRN